MCEFSSPGILRPLALSRPGLWAVSKGGSPCTCFDTAAGPGLLSTYGTFTPGELNTPSFLATCFSRHLVYTSAIPAGIADWGVCRVPKGNVLLIGGDEEARQSVGQALTNRGYAVSLAASGEEGASAARHAHPDLVILDSALPDGSCIQTCIELRAILTSPIIILGSDADDADIVLALGSGADTYLRKPVAVCVLVAHIEAATRRETIYRGRQSKANPLYVRDLTVDLAGCELRRDGAVIPLSPTEFRLIRTLAENAGRVLSRTQLLDSVWETRAEDVYSRTVDVHIGRLRRKISDDIRSPRYIVTVTGIGYKLRDAE